MKPVYIITAAQNIPESPPFTNMSKLMSCSSNVDFESQLNRLTPFSVVKTCATSKRGDSKIIVLPHDVWPETTSCKS